MVIGIGILSLHLIIKHTLGDMPAESWLLNIAGGSLIFIGVAGLIVNE